MKNYTISSKSKNYEEINTKIMKCAKVYHHFIKNYSFQISQIEDKINEYNIREEVRIKDLLENQQNIIKDLVKLLNNVIKNFEKKVVDINSSPNPKKDKNKVINNKFLSNPSLTLINNTNQPLINSTQAYGKRTIFDSIKKNDNNNHIINNNSNNNKINIKTKAVIILDSFPNRNKENIINDNLSIFNIKPTKLKRKKKFFDQFLNKENTSKDINLKIDKSLSLSTLLSHPNRSKTNHSLKINNLSNSTNKRNSKSINDEPFLKSKSSNLFPKNQITSYSVNDIESYRKKCSDSDIGKGGKRKSGANEMKKDNYFRTFSAFPNGFFRANLSLEKLLSNPKFTKSLSSSNFSKANKEDKALQRYKKDIYFFPDINNRNQNNLTRYTREVLTNSYKILQNYEHKFK